MADFLPIDSTKSPRMAQPATFMRLPHSRDLDRLDVALIGIPYDGGTSYRPGARFGPREVRNQSSIIRPYNPVMDASPFSTLNVADYGDIDPAPVSIESTYEAIERGIGEVVAKGVLPVTVGGDHSVTLPILRAIAAKEGPSASCTSTRTPTPGTSTSAGSSSTARPSGGRSRKASSTRRG